MPRQIAGGASFPPRPASSPCGQYSAKAGGKSTDLTLLISNCSSLIAHYSLLIDILLDKSAFLIKTYTMSQLISQKAASFVAFLENPIFLAPLSSLFIAQLLKAVVSLLSGRRKKAKEFFEIAFWRTGGMPSSHAALVCAMTTSAALVEGIESNLFALSLWFTLVVLRDAVGVRRSAGLLARSLNSLGRQSAEKQGLEFHAVKEIQGHSPLEVAVGGLLGVFIAAGFVLL
jgi:acid phosphatase family membrane protein YuiD